MLKLLIADSTEEFRLALAGQLAGSYIIRCTQQGKETLEQICTFRPDVVVLDLMLPELEGISILQRTAEQGLQPIVLATSRFINDYVQEAVTRMGVGYLMIKPCDVQATIDRLADLTGHIDPMRLARPDISTVISNVLLSLGIPSKMRGYSFLRESIVLAIRKPGLLITKEIYPTVGRASDANKEQVERTIRNAITAGFKHGDQQIWRQYFQPGPNGKMKRPSNGTFIYAMAERFAAGDLYSKI